MAESLMRDNIALCRKCGKHFSNRFSLGGHYKNLPDHVLPQGEYSLKAKRAAKKLIARLGLENKTPRVSKGRKSLAHRQEASSEVSLLASHIKFCPKCGYDVGKIEQAMELLSKMKG